jgi:HSP20 family molecular chaperone IbpA
MDYDYNKPDYLLPEGCKDLIDVSRQPATITTTVATTESGFIVTAQLPGLRGGDVEVIVDGRNLRIVGKLTSNQFPFESVIEVPLGYGFLGAKATYIKDELRVVIPKS